MRPRAYDPSAVGFIVDGIKTERYGFIPVVFNPDILVEKKYYFGAVTCSEIGQYMIVVDGIISPSISAQDIIRQYKNVVSDDVIISMVSLILERKTMQDFIYNHEIGHIANRDVVFDRKKCEVKNKRRTLAIEMAADKYACDVVGYNNVYLAMYRIRQHLSILSEQKGARKEIKRDIDEIDSRMTEIVNRYGDLNPLVKYASVFANNAIQNAKKMVLGD